MVRFRKTHLFTVWLILIVALFFTNWVGLKNRYLTDSYSTNNVSQVALGELDVFKPGLEMAYITPSSVFVIGGLTSTSWQNTSYRNSNWETNPLIALCVGDYDTTRKGDEIAILSQNGTLFMIYRSTFGWELENIGNLPDEPPVWTTNQMFSGQLIAESETNEIVIVGQYFNWSTTTTTGHIYVANRLGNMTWQLNQVFVEPTPLLCGTAGDVESSHSGEELLAGGVDTGVIILNHDNGTWIDNRLPSVWVDPIRSLAVGDFMYHPSGNEIALVKDQDIFVYYEQSGLWTPTSIWSARIMQTAMHSVLIGDIDPFSPGQEVLGVGSVFETDQPVLVVLRYAIAWFPTILWNPDATPASVTVMNYDFNRMGTEVIMAHTPQTTVLSVPNSMDRTIRASIAVLLPAVLLLPATLILFALADYIGRVGEARRRRRTLEMVSKGYVKCPYCRRFIPKDKAEAHRRWHRTQQFR